MEEFRLKSKQNEDNLIETHKNEITQLNHKLEELKQEFFKQCDQFESVYSRFEKEKGLIADEIKAKYRQDLERLEEKYTSNKDSLRLEKVKLSEKYEAELSRQRAELDQEQTRFAKERQEYELNLAKLKAFHERELDACRQNSTSEYTKLIDGLKANIEAMKKQKQADENEFNMKYNKKLNEVLDLEAENKCLNETLDKYKFNFENSSKEVDFSNQKVR